MSGPAEQTAFRNSVRAIQSILSNMRALHQEVGGSGQLVPQASFGSYDNWCSNVAAIIVARRGEDPVGQVMDGAPSGQFEELGFLAVEEGDLRLKPSSAERLAKEYLSKTGRELREPPGAPNHVAYPDFLYDLAKQAREAGRRRHVARGP